MALPPKADSRVVVAGDRPTGRLHLGHFVGSLQDRLKSQDGNRCFFIVADLHALTTHSDRAAELRASSENMVLDWMSVGLDPERSTFLLQSAVPEIAELSSVLSMLCPLARARRIPALKDSGRQDGYSLGLLGYPVLMAADILIFKGTDVPVGEDQVSHLELVRELARGFNHRYGPLFPEPRPALGKVPRLVGTDGARKMSKSLDNAIYLTSEPKDVERRVRAMVTDPKRVRSDIPGIVEGNPIFIYHDLFNDDRAQVEDLKSRYRAGRVGDVEVKERLAQAINRYLEPIRERRRQLERGRIDPVEILRRGSDRAREVATQSLEEVRERVGLLQFKDAVAERRAHHSLIKPFESSTAADLMASPVIALNTDTTLSEAARTLTEHEVSGALVTDHRDAVVGVVSLFDIVSHLAGLARPEEEPGGFYRYSYPRFREGGEGWDAEWEDVEPVPMKETTVGEIMTTQIIEVPPDLPARDVAKQMAERHIHRVFVSGKNGPVGVISTMDILKRVAGVAKVGARA